MEHPKQLSHEEEGVTKLAEPLEVRLSHSLARKLRSLSAEEGVGVEDFALELIAEGITLRAFEIADRRHNIQKHHQQSQHKGDLRRPSAPSRQQRYGNKRRSGFPNSRKPIAGNFQNVMEDPAAFMQYVREQEND